MTQENLSTGFVAEKGYFPIKPVKSIETAVKLSKLWFTRQNETETCKTYLLENQILFYRRAGTADVNAISALN